LHSMARMVRSPDGSIGYLSGVSADPIAIRMQKRAPGHPDVLHFALRVAPDQALKYMSYSTALGVVSQRLTSVHSSSA
jgi:hypothetical protein